MIWAWKGKKWIMNMFEWFNVREGFVSKIMVAKNEVLWVSKEVGFFYECQERLCVLRSIKSLWCHILERGQQVGINYEGVGGCVGGQ
jgi:hypothetical protein